MRNLPKGKLLAIGGNVDKGTEPEHRYSQSSNLNFFELGILKRLVKEIGKENPVIEVITSASSIPEEVGDNYFEAFAKVGNNICNLMHIRKREDAFKPEYIERIRTCDAVMFTGGNQLRLSMIYGGTEIHQILQDRYMTDENFVIAGTSAGAMAMSSTMIYQGSSTESLLKNEVKMTAGLGFIGGVIIDTHFVTRGRFGRLAQAVAANPSCIGIGLGEDTGVIISEGYKFEGVGSGLVIIFDGRSIMHTNIAEVPDGTPISIGNLVVHVMAKGDNYNLETKRFMPAGVEYDEIPEH